MLECGGNKEVKISLIYVHSQVQTSRLRRTPVWSS